MSIMDGNEIGPVFPGLVFNSCVAEFSPKAIRGIVNDQYWFDQGENPPHEWKILHMHSLIPIPITGKILEEWFGFEQFGSNLDTFNKTSLVEIVFHNAKGEKRFKGGYWSYQIWGVCRDGGNSGYWMICFPGLDGELGTHARILYVHELQRLLLGLGLPWEAEIKS